MIISYLSITRDEKYPMDFSLDPVLASKIDNNNWKYEDISQSCCDNTITSPAFAEYPMDKDAQVLM